MTTNPVLDALRRNVSGKVASGEAQAITAVELPRDRDGNPIPDVEVRATLAYLQTFDGPFGLMGGTGDAFREVVNALFGDKTFQENPGLFDDAIDLVDDFASGGYPEDEVAMMIVRQATMVLGRNPR